MLPVALAPRTGMDAYQPLGTVLVSGLLAGTLLSLLVIPVMNVLVDDLGEVLAMVVEPHPGARIDADLIREALKTRLGRLRSPKVVLSMPSLPREDSGKIARRKLKQQYLDNLARVSAAA